ncbi:MAG: chemotaxis protein CheW [bacterium]|nr:chemotaxis protein CheW [bacterium]
MNKRATKYISFSIDGTYYAMPVNAVGPFIKGDNSLPVPKANELIKGLIYQNGKIITIIDSAKLLNLPKQNKFATCLSFYRGEEVFALNVDEGSETVKSTNIFIDRNKKKFKKYIKINKNKFYILDPEEILKELAL